MKYITLKDFSKMDKIEKIKTLKQIAEGTLKLKKKKIKVT